MTLISVADLRGEVETDKSDAEIQRLIDAIDAIITRRFGIHSGMISQEILEHGDRIAWLKRPPVSISSVKEFHDWERPSDARTVGASDYSIEGRELHRDYWDDFVIASYQVNDEARRKSVILQWLTLRIQYDGLRSSRTGPLSRVSRDFALEEEKLLSTLEEHGPRHEVA